MAVVTDVKTWLERNQNFFQPPTCVKHLHESQLKVFFVGGPNKRADFHIEEGEEFFYMIKGDMCLTVLEKNTFRDIIIKEGEAFLLPGRIPHSPQRKPNTIGLVIERRRAPEEMDCLRYYVDGTKEVLYETWFNWERSASKLGEYIEDFFRSEQFRTGKPLPGSIDIEKSKNVDSERELESPVCLTNQIATVLSDDNVMKRSSIKLFEGEYKSQVELLLGHGEFEGNSPGLETFLFQLEGQAELSVDGIEFSIDLLTSALVPAGQSWRLTNKKGGVTLKVQQNSR